MSHRVMAIRIASPDRIRWSRVVVRLAETGAQRQLGLMGTEGLPDDAGMLFLMPSRSIQRFWMRDVPIGLDLAWLDGTPLVVQAVSRGLANDSREITSPVPCSVVLELPAGWFDRHQLGPGAVLLRDEGTRQRPLLPGLG